MTAAVTRFVAALVVVLLAALPVAGVVCAHECSTPMQATEGAAEHCHTDDASGTVTINAAVPDGCSSPFAITRIAARDRGVTPVGAAPLGEPPLQVLDVALMRGHDRLPAFAPPARAAGLSAGAHIPLRI